MKWFYIAAILTAVVLGASPYVLIRPTRTESLEGKVIAYSTYGSKVRSIDPATCTDTTSAGIQASFYESPYTYHFLKRPAEVIPQLAAAMPEVSPDGLTFTIRLKPGVKYCRNDCFAPGPDGIRTRTVRAEDFVLAFKRIADFHMNAPLALPFIEDRIAGIGEYRERTRAYDKGDFSRYDLPLEGVKAIDELTLQIKLVRPFPQLLYVLAINNYAPVPREVIDHYLATTDDGHGGRMNLPFKERSPQINNYRAAVGTGPFRLAKFGSGTDIVLERNPDFREVFYPAEGAPGDREAGLLDDAGKRIPFIDGQVLTYVPEDNPAWSLFLAKLTDVSGIPPEQFHAVVTPTQELTHKFAQQNIRIIKYTGPSVYWYAFNMDYPPLGKSRSLRQAMCLAFNVEQYVDVLFNGRGRRAMNVVPSEFPESADLPPSPYAKFDLRAAQEKMAQARAELEAAGLLRPGEPIKLTLDLGGRDEYERRAGEYAKYSFKRIGIDLKVELNDWPTLQEKVENKQCQLYAMGWAADYPDPENFLQLYYGPNIPKGMNNSNYANREFDALYDRAAVMMPSKERTEIYRRMVQILNEDCPIILLTEPVSMVLVQPWVHNVKPHPLAYGMLRYQRIDAAMQHRAREGG